MHDRQPAPERASPAATFCASCITLGAMQTVSAFVPRDPTSCWRVFTDASQLLAWVPGLRRAEILTRGPRGLPSEIHFEFASSLAYTLIYDYDVEHHEVRFQPKIGPRDGVTGFVRFDPAAGGTQVTYALEHGPGRSEADRALGDVNAAIAAFVTWMCSAR